jgi:hypothetical protein
MSVEVIFTDNNNNGGSHRGHRFVSDFIYHLTPVEGDQGEGYILFGEDSISI